MLCSASYLHSSIPHPQDLKRLGCTWHRFSLTENGIQNKKYGQSEAISVFSGSRLILSLIQMYEGRDENFRNNVKSTTKALILYKHPSDLYSVAVHIAPLPTLRSCGPGFPRHHLPFSASHPLLSVTSLLQYVLFLNQSNVVISYPAEEGGGRGGGRYGIMPRGQ